jgi:hypothetical protein
MQNNPMALVIPVRGDNLGLCEFCNTDSARMHCDKCGQGNFCAYPCLGLATRTGRHICAPTSAKESEVKPEADCEAKSKVESEDESDDDLTAPADYLMSCALTSKLPQLPHVRQRYFFHRCETKQDEYNLLSVYTILLETCGITPKELEEWRLDNVVYQETVRAFNRNLVEILPCLCYWLKMKESRDIFETPSDVNLKGDPLKDEEIESLVPEYPPAIEA